MKSLNSVYRVFETREELGRFAKKIDPHANLNTLPLTTDFPALCQIHLSVRVMPKNELIVIAHVLAEFIKNHLEEEEPDNEHNQKQA